MSSETFLDRGKGRRRPLMIGLVGVLLLVILVLSPCLKTDTLCGRWLIWRAPDPGSFAKYPQATLSNDSLNVSSLPTGNAVPAIDDFIYQNRNIDSYLETNNTAAFIVVQNDTIVYEKYFNGATRETAYTAFSITKSFCSALLGIAIDQGFISNVNDSITKYLPELAKEFDKITLEHLLMMSSGVRYSDTKILGLVPAWWSDEYKATFSPDMRSTLLNLRVDSEPMTHFSYNNYNSGLIGLAIERATNQSLTEFAQANLWQPLGTEFSATWSIDSDELEFPHTDSGLNVRAVDLARFGLLFLHKGYWNQQQIISSSWVDQSTTTRNVLLEEKNRAYVESTDVPEEIERVIDSWRYYYLWWGVEREDHSAVFANGHLGQFIYVVPDFNLVIIRTGFSWGDNMNDDMWLQFFYELVSNQKRQAL